MFQGFASKQPPMQVQMQGPDARLLWACPVAVSPIVHPDLQLLKHVKSFKRGLRPSPGRRQCINVHAATEHA